MIFLRVPTHVITQLLTLPPPPPRNSPNDEHPCLYAGQFWMLRGTATERGGLFWIITASTQTTPSITLQRWMGIEQLTWRPTPTIGQRVRPADRIEQLPRSDFAARSHRRVVVHLPAPHQVGILTHFMDTYQVTVPHCAHWTDTLDPHKHWRIYANGYWKARTSPYHEHHFFTGDSHGGGGLSRPYGNRWGLGAPPHHRTPLHRGRT